MRHSLFYWSVAGFVVGIFIRSQTSVQISLIVSILFVVCAVFFYVQDHKIILIICFSVLLACLGILRYEWFVHTQSDEIFRTLIDQKVQVRGIVVSEPEERETSRRMVVSISVYTNNEGNNFVKDTRILITDSLYSTLRYGDDVALDGTLMLPENFESENGREFDYRSYLAKDKIFYIMRYPKVTHIGHHKASWIKEKLFFLKDRYIKNIDKVVSYPESRLGAGITIAGKRALPSVIQNEFERTGTLQVVVLSGYNITIVAESLMSAVSYLPRNIGVATGLGGIILFTIIAGGSATIVRGSIMAGIVIGAKVFRRGYDVTRSLTIAGVLMLIINPMLLVYDPSFQLSFLATFGLIYVSPMVEKHCCWITERYNLRQTFASTLATQIFVTPFILYLTGNLSLVAVFANLVLSMMIPFTMLLCFMTGVTGFVSMFLSIPFGYLSFMLLTTELKIIHMFSSIPYASVAILSFPLWLLVVSYVGYAVAIIMFYKKNIKK